MDLYHISFNDNLPSILHPKIPNGSTDTVTEFSEILPPRVCFAPTIRQCWLAIYPNVSKYFEEDKYPWMDFYVYKYKGTSTHHPIPRETMLGKVQDAHITDEVSFIVPVPIKRIAKIRIYNPEPNPVLVYHRPYNDRSKTPLVTGPEIVYLTLESYSKQDIIPSTGMNLYHYSAELWVDLRTRKAQGLAKADEVQQSTMLAQQLGDLGSYLEHISLFIEPLPLDKLPKLFGGSHPFYRSGQTVYQYTITVRVADPNMPWSLVESPAVGKYTDQWDWSNVDKETRRGYIRKMNDYMHRHKYHGLTIRDMLTRITPFMDKTEEFFIQARKSKWANDTKEQYAAEVPHLMVYPVDGILKPTHVEKLKFS